MRQLLAHHLFDLRELTPADFPVWLERHLTSWRQDPVFQQRARIRDLRRANPRLQDLEAERHRARVAYEAAPLYAELEAVRRALAGAENAVAGLIHAEARATEPEERERLRVKLESFVELVDRLRDDVRELVARSDERIALDRVAGRLEEAREAVGFYREVAVLEKLQRTQGRSSGRSGAGFETVAMAAVRELVLPELPADPGGPPLVVLRGATLGAARTEIDQLVVRANPAADDAPVEVVAMVEAKRNPNDLAHGLSRRLENLAWLVGHTDGYDPAAYRTGASPSGHFDGVAIHTEAGRRYRFTRDSFRRFLPDLETGALPRGLYLVTRMATLWGIGSGGLARIAHRVSSDIAWEPDDPAYLAALLRWCQELAGPVEAPDVLRRYATEEEVARRVMIIEG